jgi:hypothetical protein
MSRNIMRRGEVLGLAALLVMATFLASGRPAAAQDDLDAEAIARYADQTLRVSLWLNKDSEQVYERGEILQATFQTNEDAYAVVYRIDAEGLVTVLWPTTRYSDGFVFGGHRYRLPARDGARLRVASDEGLGYVRAVVSRYPFDLRDVEIDFHHEPIERPFDFYVAGDPYLAMNEVNFAITGLEDPSGYVVTNHVSYYVHRKVDHPRYLCFQCHDPGIDSYAPYGDSCTVSIQYDYGWMNDWWLSYGYYPAYYYPVYYYVDPWTRARWVNYWYDPWYRWPHVTYVWNYTCYDWNHSPYWDGNSWTAYKEGRKRYTPLDKQRLGRDRADISVRTKNTLVVADRPGDERVRAMKERTVVSRERDAVRDVRSRGAGGRASNVAPVDRSQARYEPDSRIRTTPGLRVPGQAPDAVRPQTGRTSRTGEIDRDRTSRSPRLDRSRTRVERPADRPGVERRTVRPERGESDTDRRAIRPVQPRRGDGDRVWSNRRSSGSSRVTPQRPPVRRDSGNSDRGTTIRRQERPTSPPNKVRGGSSQVRPRNSSPPSRPAPPPSRPSSGSKTGSKSGGKARGSGGR